jgi:RNA polymerase sigma-70 factor, ECF subfamily
MLEFEQIYLQHKDLVYNLCLNYLQNRHDAEEAAQDIFVKIHQKLSTFESKSSLKTWIYRVTVNHCLDILRAKKRQNQFAYITSFFLGKSEAPLEIPQFDHPGVLLEDKEAMESLFKKVNQLPENQRTAIILKYLDDLPQREIAAIMQLSEKAVESLLQRAKQKLENKIKEDEGRDR